MYPAKKDSWRAIFPVVSLLHIALDVFENHHCHSFFIGDPDLSTGLLSRAKIVLNQGQSRSGIFVI